MIFKRVTSDSTTNWKTIRDSAWGVCGGLCALCAFDIAKMERELWEYHRRGGEDLALTKRFAKIIFGLRARNFPKVCWAVDHIKPIAEGGESLPTLEGVRVLCLLCHDVVTRELRARMAVRRKRHRWMPL